MLNIKNIINAEPNTMKKGLLKKQFNSGVKNAFTRKNYITKAVTHGLGNALGFDFGFSYRVGFQKAKALANLALPDKYKKDPRFKIQNNNLIDLITICIIKIWKQNLTKLTDYDLLVKSAKAYHTQKYILDGLDKLSMVFDDFEDNQQDSQLIDAWLKDDYNIYFEKLKISLKLGSKQQTIFLEAQSLATILALGFIEANKGWFIFKDGLPDQVTTTSGHNGRFMLLLPKSNAPKEKRIRLALREYLSDKNRNRNVWLSGRKLVPGGTRKIRK